MRGLDCWLSVSIATVATIQILMGGLAAALCNARSMGRQVKSNVRAATQDGKISASLDMSQLAQHAAQAETLLKALANSHSLMVLCSLHEQEASVGELNRRVPLSQSALSQHLATLRNAGLVATRREAQTIYYRLEDPNVRVLIATLHGLFCAQNPE